MVIVFFLNAPPPYWVYLATFAAILYSTYILGKDRDR
jgi:hypothetical protein